MMMKTLVLQNRRARCRKHRFGLRRARPSGESLGRAGLRRRLRTSLALLGVSVFVATNSGCSGKRLEPCSPAAVAAVDVACTALGEAAGSACHAYAVLEDCPVYQKARAACSGVLVAQELACSRPASGSGNLPAQADAGVRVEARSSPVTAEPQ